MTDKQLRHRIAFLTPATLIILLFFVLPGLLCVAFSFTNLALTGSNAKQLSFVGLTNYANMLKDRSVIRAVSNTIIFTLGSIAGQSVFGFAIAYILRGTKPWVRRIVGSVVMMGWVMPEVVAAACMNSLFHDNGTLNVILEFMGIAKVSWLFSHPMLAVVAANIWRGTAFSMINYQAALDDVDTSILESAMLDGCGPLSSVLRIILPVLKGTIATNSMLVTLSTLGCFGMIWIMTGGGPGGKTSTLSVLMYIKAFQSSQLGYGVAISMVLLVIGVVFGIFNTHVLAGGKKE